MVLDLVCVLTCPSVKSSGLQAMQGFSEFPSSVRRVILSDSSGPVFLGSPIWGPPGVFAAFVYSVIERVSVLQGRLWDLDNPQVELHLLHSCLGVCKLNHLLRIRFLLIPYCHSFGYLIVIFVILCLVYAI